MGYKHGETANNKTSAEYKCYFSALDRCRNPKRKDYKYYGGRGIEFRFTSFSEFLNEIGRKPSPDYSIERIDVNGHYEKGNVRWATKQEQSRNKRSARFITVGGKTLNIVEWTALSKLSSNAIYTRINAHGWCNECAVTLPSYSRCPHVSKSSNQ